MKNAGKYLMVSAVVIVVAQNIGGMIGHIRAGVSPFFNFSFYDLFIQIVAAGIVALIGLILLFSRDEKRIFSKSLRRTAKSPQGFRPCC